MRFSRTTRAGIAVLIAATMFLMLGMTYPQALGDSDWVAQTTDPGMSSSFWDVDFVDEMVGYAVDYGSGVWCTTDGGRNWELLNFPKPDNYPSLDDPAEFAIGLEFLTEKFGRFILQIFGQDNFVIAQV